MAKFIEIKWDIPSMKRVVANLKKKQLQTEAGAREALTEMAEAIMQESKILETPIDTGSLMSTAHIYKPVKEGKTIRVRMGYAGPKDMRNPVTKKMVSSYALMVHETPDWLEHFIHPHGKWKYLEDPVRRYTDKMLLFIGSRLSRVFSGGISPR